MPGPSRYNRQLKAKNDRRKARAAKGGRTPSEAGLGESMAAAGNKVSSSNRRVGAPATKPKFGKPRKARRTGRPDYDSMTLDELARQPNLPKKYREAAGLAAARPDYDRVKDTQRMVGEDGEPLSRLEVAGQLAEVGSLVIPTGGSLAAAGRILATTGRTAPKVARGASAAAKAAQSGKAGSKVKNAVKAAPKKTAKRVKGAGQKAKNEAKALGTKKGAARAARGAAKAPVKVARSNPAVATGAYSVAADKAGVGDPVTRTIAADTRGIVDAVDSWDDFVKTSETTARAVPGIFAGVAAAGLAGGITAGRAGLAGLDRTTGGRLGKDYDARQIVSPVVEEGKKTIEGTAQIAKPFIEGDQEGVKEAVQEQVGLLPIVAGPKAISMARNSRAAQGVRQGTRTVASNRRNKKNEKIEAENKRQTAKGQRGTKAKKIKNSPTDRVYGGEYAIPRLGRAIEGTRGRSRSAKDAARAKGVADVRTARILRPVMKLARGIAVPKGKDAGDYRGAALNAMSTVLAYGIPRDYDTAVAWMNDIERGIAMPKTPPKISDRGNFDFLRNNPELFRDENFWKARDYLAKQQDEITTSEVKRYLGQGAALGIKNPDERLAQGVWVGGEPRPVTREAKVPEAVPESYLDPAARALARKERRDRRRAGISERRTGRRRATRQSKAYDPSPEAINERVFYQGGNAEGLDARSLDPDMTRADNLFGMGIYLTTSSKVARGYAKARSKRSGKPQLYRSRVKVKNALDLDAPLDPRFRDRLIQFAEYMEGSPLRDYMGEGADRTSVRLRQVASDPNTTNAYLYSVLREDIADASRDAGYASYDLDDEFAILREDLVADGWDAFTHRGGKRTGGRDHQTVIVLDPAIVTRFDTRGNRPIGPEPRPVGRVPKMRTGRRVETVMETPGTLVKMDRGRKEDQQRQREIATLKNLRAELRAANRRGDMEEVERLTPVVARTEKKLKDQTQATRKAQADFVAETRAAAAERGLETPTYVRSWGEREGLDQAAPFPASGVLSQRNWIDRDTKRKSGESERAWDDFVRDSIYKPRAQRIYHDLVSEFASSNAIRLRSARGNSVFLTMNEIAEAIKRGEINPDDHVAFHSQHFRSAVQDPAKINRDTGIGAFFRLDDAGRADLAKLDAEIRGRAADKGNKYIVVPRPDAEELVNQFTGQNKWQKMADVNRLGSRIVLGYNPSWAIAQLVAEGIPTAVAVGFNPARLRRMRQATKERNQNPEMADLMDGTAGQTAGTTVIPKRDRGLDTKGEDIPTGAPLTPPGRFGSEILSALKGEALGRFDRAKGGGFRKMVLAAQIDREVNGFMRGLGSFLKLDDQVKGKLKGMSPAEQQAYLLRNPKTARALEQYLDDVMGNWRAISNREEMAASFVAFYPYIRYAIKTAFWGFPKRHPIKSSILYFFAQLNANELEEIVGDGGSVLDWINYAYPVVSVDGEQRVAPGAARVAPALSVVAEAIGGGNIERLMSGLTPLLGVARQAIQGQDFTGRDIADERTDNVLIGLAALAAMVAPIRAASTSLDPEGDGIDVLGARIPSIRSITPRRTTDDEGNQITVVGGRSSTSQYLGDRDIDRGFPSIVNPFQTIGEKDFRERQEVIDLLNRGAWRDLPGSVTSSTSSSSSSTSSTPSVTSSRSSLSTYLP